MRSLTRPGILLAIAVAVVALPTAASGGLSGAAKPTLAASNTTTYTDSTGEDPAAPDITTIVASNDDAATISFKVNIPNRAQYTPDVAIIMFLDSDANQTTGDPESLGADYIIQLIQGEILLFKWDGADYTLSATQASLSYAWASGPTIRINASDLNNTRRLNFDMLAVSNIVIDPVTGAIDCTGCKRDAAPVFGFYTYEVKITPPTLVVRKFSRTPSAPTAGKAFTLRLATARSDTGAVVQNGRVTCVGRIGNARLRAQVQRVVAGAATCTWNVPPLARGKTFRGSVAIAFEGLKAAQSFSGKVR
ncbi:MAG: hypothetical protein ACRDOF_00380 [Gaiellaceae bacterium]